MDSVIGTPNTLPFVSSTPILPTGCDISPAQIPSCDDELKPKINMEFDLLDDAINFYRNYAKACGFDIRKHTGNMLKSGLLKDKRICCSHEGHHSYKPVPNSPSHSKVKRMRTSKRVGCKAHILFKARESKFFVFRFVEEHNHPLSTPHSELFLKSRRYVNSLHMKFIAYCSTVNVGPVKAYRLFKALCGGYEKAGVTLTDFKNISRDLQAFVGGSDAQMVIDNLARKQDVCESFYFDFDVDETGTLIRLFWADPISRDHYSCFGDSISFDTTYRTNKYSMVFAPFTGVDHHKRCITFGAGLLAKEDVESFTWLSRRFLEAFGNPPTSIITDQDPAMKIAIETVFQGTHHRLCMWHIMEKVSSKVGPISMHKDGFHSAFFYGIWDKDTDIPTFEHKWNDAIKKYKLEGNVWLQNMYELRGSWIPCYSKDVFMGGLFRTTSRSESENSFFSQFIGPKSSLVEFFLRFDTAMDAQRYEFNHQNHLSYSTTPECKTPLAIEKHAAELYTRSMFSEVQAEIVAACFKCRIVDVSKNTDSSVYVVRDSKSRNFEVHIETSSKKGKCSCKKLEFFGIPCRHLLNLYLNEESFPDFMLLNRWSKYASKCRIHVPNETISIDSARMRQNKKMMNDAWLEFNKRLEDAEQNSDLEGFLNHIKSYQPCSNQVNEPSGNKDARFESLLGVKKPTEISILPPNQSRNRGSKRPIGEKEALISRSKKNMRQCKTCFEYCYHDSRTCPKKSQPQAE